MMPRGKSKKDFNIALVKKVKEYPALWDTTDKNYNKPNHMEECWKRIAREMRGTSAAEVKKSWNQIKSLHKNGHVYQYLTHDSLLSFLTPTKRKENPPKQRQASSFSSNVPEPKAGPSQITANSNSEPGTQTDNINVMMTPTPTEMANAGGRVNLTASSQANSSDSGLGHFVECQLKIMERNNVPRSIIRNLVTDVMNLVMSVQAQCTPMPPPNDRYLNFPPPTTSRQGRPNNDGTWNADDLGDAHRNG